MAAIQFRTVDSPVGPLTLAGRGGRLMHLRMVDQTYEPSHDGWERDDAAFPDAVEQLESYFAGERTEFDLELDLRRHDVPAQRVGGAADHPVRRDAVLRRDRGADRLAGSVPRGGSGQRPQSDRHHRALPSGDRFERQPHRIRRRTGPQARSARIGEEPEPGDADAIRLTFCPRNAFAPQQNWGAKVLNCVRRCPTFPPGLGSIIGAGRLSFRVRDGSGRFPVAISAVTLFILSVCGVVFGGGVWLL